MGWDRYPRRHPRRRYWRRSDRQFVYLAAVLGFVVVFVGAERLPQFFNSSNVWAALTGSSGPSKLPTVVTAPNDSNFIAVAPSSGQSVRVEAVRTDVIIIDGHTVRSYSKDSKRWFRCRG
jgi:hypothetical protein